MGGQGTTNFSALSDPVNPVNPVEPGFGRRGQDERDGQDGEGRKEGGKAELIGGPRGKEFLGVF